MVSLSVRAGSRPGRRSVWAAVAALVTLSAAPVAAQSVSEPSAEVRAQARDLAIAGGLQLRTALGAGPAGVGAQRTLGGFGRFALGVRLAAIPTSVLPDLREAGPGALIPPTLDVGLPVARVDATVGLFRGLPLPQGRIGAVDALVSATVLPGVQLERLRFGPQMDGSNVALTGGARIGLLEGVPRIPSLSLVWMRRELPVAELGFTRPGTFIGVEAVQVQHETVRVQASQRLGRLFLDVGAGVDESRLTAVTRVQQLTGGPTVIEGLPQDIRSRASYFAGITLPLGPVHVTGRVAQSRGAAPAMRSALDVRSLEAITTAGLTVGVRF